MTACAHTHLYIVYTIHNYSDTKRFMLHLPNDILQAQAALAAILTLCFPLCRYVFGVYYLTLFPKNLERTQHVVFSALHHSKLI